MSLSLSHSVCDLVEFFFNIPGIRRKQIRRLAGHYPDLASCLRQGPENLAKKLPDLESASLKSYFQEVIARASSSKKNFLSYLNPIFPPRLEHLHDPPCGFYFRGRAELLQFGSPWIGIVGTRYPSPYALKACAALIEAMRPYRPVIVSGMALGIDGMAHQTALEHGLETVGVLGCGIDEVYPSRHANLFKRMEEKGLLITEVGEKSLRGAWRFPERNRIIAALSEAVLILEAPEKSGALITAKHALELGKEIFVLPGRTDHPKNVGGHRLIQDGAHLLMEVEEVFSSLGFQTGASKSPKGVEVSQDLSAEAQKILNSLRGSALHIDKIAHLSELPAPRVSGLIMELVLSGHIAELPGKVFEIID